VKSEVVVLLLICTNILDNWRAFEYIPSCLCICIYSALILLIEVDWLDPSLLWQRCSFWLRGTFLFISLRALVWKSLKMIIIENNIILRMEDLCFEREKLLSASTYVNNEEKIRRRGSKYPYISYAPWLTFLSPSDEWVTPVWWLIGVRKKNSIIFIFIRTKDTNNNKQDSCGDLPTSISGLSSST